MATVSLPRSRTFTFLGPQPGWPLCPLLLQTRRQALLARIEPPWAETGALMVKGRARGHSKSFTNISQSFIIFALPTAAHKSTKVHEFRPPQRLRAVQGLPLIQGIKSADALRGQSDFRGRVMPWPEWGFSVPKRPKRSNFLLF